MLIKFFLFLSLCFSSSLFAMPKKFEIWILSVEKEREPASIEESFSKCDPDNKFDIFCGKSAKPQKKNQKQEVWMSIAESMKVVDQDCLRASFLRRVEHQCSPNISIFDSAKKEIGMFQDACTSQGESNTDRLIENIKNSKVNHLVVILDISQVTQNLQDFVAMSKGKGSFKGLDKPFHASNLAKNVTSLCR